MQDYVRKVWIAVGIGALVLLLTGLVGYLLQGALVVFAGVVFGIFLAQVSRTLGEWTGLPYGGSYGLVVGLFLVFLIGMLLFMGTRIALEAEQFIEQFQQAGSRLEERLQKQPWYEHFARWRQNAMQALTSRQAFVAATSWAYLTFTALIGAVFVLFLGFYFALQPDRYRKGLLLLVPPARRERVAEVLNKIVVSLWYWLLGRVVGMLLVGTGTAIGLWALGVPLPVPLGVLAGFLDFIPNFGPLIALVPAVLFALQQGTDTAVYVIIFFFVIQSVESYLLVPFIDQHQVAFPPGLTLSVQMLFGLLGGLMGLLLAMPIAVVISVVVREFYVRDILGSPPRVDSVKA